MIKNNLTFFLKENKDSFKQSCIELAEDLIGSCFRVALLRDLTDFKEMKSDSKIISDVINNIIESPNSLIFKERLTSWGRFLENEIRFDVYRGERQIGRKTASYEAFEPIFKKTSLECFNEYWNDDMISCKNEYEKISDFKCYLDLLVPNEDVENIKKQGVNFNIKDWNTYTIQLLNRFFPEFTYCSKISTHNLRFMKKLNEDWSLGIEYNKNIFNRSKKTGSVEFPDYFNLILLNKDYDKKSKPDYVYSFDNGNIISLGILGNPFFYPPLMPSLGYESDYLTRFTPPNNYTLLTPQWHEDNKDGTTSILHDHEHGEKVKKYLYFYMDILSRTSKSYIEYVEKCLMDIFREC